MAKKYEFSFDWASSKLNELIAHQSDGTVGLHGWSERGVVLDDILSMIGTHYGFDREVPDVERHPIVLRAALAEAKSGSITADSLKRRIRKLGQEFTTRPVVDFVIVTSLSVNRPARLDTVTLEGVTFHFSDELAEGFSRDRPFPFNLRELPAGFLPGYTIVRAELKARTPAEAISQGIGTLDFLRGIWNFQINHAVKARYSTGPAEPVNVIRLGQIHSLHKPTGDLHEPGFWHELIYPNDSRVGKLDDWDAVYKNQAEILKLIDRSPYRDFIKESFARYTRCLDGSNFETSFLKLWSLLEALTAVKEDESHSEVIKRTVFLFEDSDYHTRVLEHIRARRNAAVHRDESSPEMGTFVYQLKEYVEHLIRFHLLNNGTVASPNEAGLLLSKPREPADLERLIANLKAQISLCEMALKIRSDDS